MYEYVCKTSCAEMTNRGEEMEKGIAGWLAELG
jgi:hypothetical protein